MSATFEARSEAVDRLHRVSDYLAEQFWLGMPDDAPHFDARYLIHRVTAEAIADLVAPE